MEKMKYVNLGNTGLKVSKISFGNWVNCPKGAQEQANKLVKLAFDNGINFFDTAQAYGLGEGEKQLGEALKALGVPREDYVLTTKIWMGFHSMNKIRCNLVGTNRKHLIEGLNRSLKSLNHEYVDVLFCHRFDHTTPLVEVIQAMKDIISSGKAHHWATSEWQGVRIMEAIHLCDKLGCPRPIADQCEYNMIQRTKMEQSYTALFDDYGYGTTIWSPLASGILTGKYNDGIPEGSRFDKNSDLMRVYNKYFCPELKDGNVAKIKAIMELAKSLDITTSQLAIAWTLINKDVSTCILGASSEAQLLENLGAFDACAKLTPEVLEKIESILKNAPEQESNYTGVPIPKRR